MNNVPIEQDLLRQASEERLINKRNMELAKLKIDMNKPNGSGKSYLLNFPVNMTSKGSA